MQTASLTPSARTSGVCTTSRKSPPKRQRKPAPRLELVQAPRTGDPYYWVASALRCTTKCVAFAKHVDQVFNALDDEDALNMALFAAKRLLAEEAAFATEQVIGKGQLLFAWHGTTLIGGAA